MKKKKQFAFGYEFSLMLCFDQNQIGSSCEFLFSIKDKGIRPFATFVPALSYAHTFSALMHNVPI